MQQFNGRRKTSAILFCSIATAIHTNLMKMLHIGHTRNLIVFKTMELKKLKQQFFCFV
jgi:hypothetical protein